LDRLPGIAIVGASVEGLALALACREAGTGPVTLVDVPLQPWGPTHYLSPNGARVLHALGLRQALAERALMPQWTLLRSGRSGAVLFQRPLGPFSEARYGAPDYLIEHHELDALLREALPERRLERLSAAPRTLDIEHGTVSFADGSRQSFGACIGCDGPGGFVSRELGLDAEATQGWLCWSGSVDIDRLPAALARPVISLWLGPDYYLVTLPVGRRERLAVQLFPASPVPVDAAVPAPPLADFRGWRSELRDALAAVPEWRHQLVPDQPVAEYWHAGRAAVAGPAGGPLPPFLLQQAALGLEDAWVLSRMLERWDEAPHQGLADYARFRRARVRRVARASVELARRHTRADPRGAWWRNLKMALGGRFLPEAQMAEFDWLYGYDCIRGFE